MNVGDTCTVDGLVYTITDGWIVSPMNEQPSWFTKGDSYQYISCNCKILYMTKSGNWAAIITPDGRKYCESRFLSLDSTTDPIVAYDRAMKILGG